jgi:hypothetical protein
MRKPRMVDGAFMDYSRLMSDRLESWPQAMFKVPLAGHASLSPTF